MRLNTDHAKNLRNYFTVYYASTSIVYLAVSFIEYEYDLVTFMGITFLLSLIQIFWMKIKLGEYTN